MERRHLANEENNFTNSVKCIQEVFTSKERNFCSNIGNLHSDMQFLLKQNIERDELSSLNAYVCQYKFYLG